MSTINYAIIRSPKRKTVSIVIRPDNRVDVLAPEQISTALIAAFVQDNRAWIDKKLHFNRSVRAVYVPKTFQPGESFQLLGTTYTLRLQQGKRAIRLSEHELLVSHPAPAPQTTERQIERWYRQQAETHFQTRSQCFAAMLGKQPKLIGIKAYKSRWGSCHHDGRIYFNWRLIMAPASIVDYVVVHELCHLIHPNHSKHFWSLVQSAYPDHRAAKAWLKINGLTLSL